MQGESDAGERIRRLGSATWQIALLVLVVGASLYGALTPRVNLAVLGRGYVVRLDLDEISKLSARRESKRPTLAESSAARQGNELLANADKGHELAAVAAPLLQASAGAPESAGSVSGQSNVVAQTSSFRVLPLDFSLSAGPDQASALEVAKRLRLDDRELGILSVRIDEASRIFVSRTELARLLPGEAALPTGTAGDYILLRDLRRSGFDLRYDPVRDELVLRE